ncbi:MAG: DNA polymerase bacteriophage-type [Parcubacteria group bacterium Gr01-1014_48]|nr:MAG: DNA polymerase bacteriophage-type [Parcubacteria group bacterium Greene0416_14]TSC74408.1 MAG: DNA polymerase bacteriophage-type [Parcubacteria group bacterium Gr01-1014_48]TSD01262.1 MAG: DNA polymerase bacteriophage-type [Parcubacteria group bacterium Greene1014_15]TSD08417.1 MAG: DNA polymerase bacteriophage-type [Parcubacteria group bacterium Greene0714_4]
MTTTTPRDFVSRTDLMRQIKDEILNLTGSPLCAERIRNKVFPVIGEGSHEAKIMFVGEAPGKNEAATGRPFCGASGRVLDELLASIELPRTEVYVTNIVKDRPTANRDPLPEEIVIYGPFLDRQIDIIQPKVIATLGRFSMSYVMNRYGLSHELGQISNLHGRVFTTATSFGSMKVVPLFHPAVAIYNIHTKEVLMEDFKKLKKLSA